MEPIIGSLVALLALALGLALAARRRGIGALLAVAFRLWLLVWIPLLSTLLTPNSRAQAHGGWMSGSHTGKPSLSPPILWSAVAAWVFEAFRPSTPARRARLGLLAGARDRPPRRPAPSRGSPPPQPPTSPNAAGRPGAPSPSAPAPPPSPEPPRGGSSATACVAPPGSGSTPPTRPAAARSSPPSTSAPPCCGGSPRTPHGAPPPEQP